MVKMVNVTNITIYIIQSPGESLLFQYPTKRIYAFVPNRQNGEQCEIFVISLPQDHCRLCGDAYLATIQCA